MQHFQMPLLGLKQSGVLGGGGELVTNELSTEPPGCWLAGGYGPSDYTSGEQATIPVAPPVHTAGLHWSCSKSTIQCCVDHQQLLVNTPFHELYVHPLSYTYTVLAGVLSCDSVHWGHCSIPAYLIHRSLVCLTLSLWGSIMLAVPCNY